MTVTPSVLASMPASGHREEISAIDFFISVLKWAKSFDVFNSLVAKLAAIISQVVLLQSSGDRKTCVK